MEESNSMNFLCCSFLYSVVRLFELRWAQKWKVQVLFCVFFPWLPEIDEVEIFDKITFILWIVIRLFYQKVVNRHPFFVIISRGSSLINEDLPIVMFTTNHNRFSVCHSSTSYIHIYDIYIVMYII